MQIVTNDLGSDKVKVAVYGSLRKGLGNHGTIEDGDFLGDFESQPEYTMFSIAGAYPGLLEKGTTSIQMEVYEVDEFVFDDVNYLEGFTSDDNPHNMYNRKLIETPYGDAYLYIYNGNTEGLYIVESGDWAKFKKTSNVVNGASC